MNRNSIKTLFKIFIFGYSEELLQACIVSNNPETLDRILNETIVNYFYYLTEKINLHGENIYIFYNVISKGMLYQHR